MTSGTDPGRPRVSGWQSFWDTLRADSLVRRLVRRLLPALLILLAIDLLATWAITSHWAVEPMMGTQPLQDLFWVMLALQLLLVALFVWVLISGVRTELRALRHLGDDMRQRSVDDLQPFDPAGLPLEMMPLILHFNELLQRLDASVQAQRRFIGQAAHQLRTPLAGLKLESELMLGQNLDDALRARVVRIKGVTDRMIRMGQQLLILARADHSTRPQDTFVRLDLCEWLRQSGARWLGRVREHGVDFQLQAPADAILIDGDPLLLDELLGNLIDNALRHGLPMRRMVLRALPNPPAIAVEEDGVGMGDADVSRVFEPFYRGGATVSGGSGLGLAIVQEIARAHGAWVKAASRPQFPGTQVMVVFPGPRRGASLRAGSRNRDGHAPQDTP